MKTLQTPTAQTFLGGVVLCIYSVSVVEPAVEAGWQPDGPDGPPGCCTAPLPLHLRQVMNNEGKPKTNIQR